ncbi:MAG: hypothetical protein H7Z14_13250 [Anaerolineae bacterium]|nr:hypothetical protein [Phycisphaerae bacterium]
MPPVNQGSRTALVTWTVVTSFLFVLATIFAIYYYVDANRLTNINDTITKKYHDVVPESALAGQEIAALGEVRGKTEYGYNASAGLLDVSLQRSDKLSKLVAGAAAQSPERAIADGQGAIAAAAEAVKPHNINLQADNLISALNLLRDAAVQRSTEAANARKQADDAVAQMTKSRQDTDAQIKVMTDQLGALRAELDQANVSVASMTQAKDAQLEETAKGSDLKLSETQQLLDKSNQSNQELQKQVTSLSGELKKVQEKLSEIRPDVNRPVTSQSDGRIVRLPGPGIAYIDLGRSDQIVPGMTFEVYDRNEGIPPIGDPTTDVNLPKGKGSIEITRVGATSSEGRIVNAAAGNAMVEGDIVANLIYDRNTKNKFLVYGNFDLTRTGKPTAQDGEVIKRLISQWGAQVVPDINVDTDFVVLGAEPQIPTLTREEREDPVQKAIYDKAVAEAEAYSNISAKARDYRIPILNQNRFLYMIGYYELSKR